MFRGLDHADPDGPRGEVALLRAKARGIGSGDRAGAVYAEAFPQNVRAMALDSAVDPDLSVVEFRLA